MATAAKPRAPRNRKPTAAAGTPSLVSGSVPFSLQIDPLNVRVAAQLVSAGQPVTQALPGAASAAPLRPAPAAGLHPWALPGIAIAVLLLMAGLFVYLFTRTPTPAPAAPASVVMTPPAAQPAPAPAAVGNGGNGGSAEATASVYLDSQLLATQRSRNGGGTQPTAPQAPAPASQGGNPPASTPNSGNASIPPYGCMLLVGSKGVTLKGSGQTLANGAEVARMSYQDIYTSTDPAIVGLRNASPNWLTSKQGQDQLCAGWRKMTAERLVVNPQDLN